MVRRMRRTNRQLRMLQSQQTNRMHSKTDPKRLGRWRKRLDEVLYQAQENPADYHRLVDRHLRDVADFLHRHYDIQNRSVAAFDQDRKSTRLNSSHSSISYAVFCLKKKNNKLIILFIQKKNKNNN